jgi:hypothetical protein
MQVLTQLGFRNFDGIISRGIVSELLKITFDDETFLKCTQDHRLLSENEEFIEAKYLKIGDVVYPNNRVCTIEYISDEEVYDLINVEETNSYLTNGVYSHNCVYLDEFAFVENAEDFFKSTYPVISSGVTSKIIITSTPNGLNYFHKLWKDALEKRSDFGAFEISWDKVPGRDEAWKQRQVALLGEHGFRQEYGNEFLGSSNTLISGDVLQRLTWENPIRVSDDGVWKYLEDPKENHRYVVVVDTARGQEADSSTMIVIDYSVIPYRIVATYKSNKVRALVLPTLLVDLAKRYNQAYLLIERNSIGQAVVEQCWYELEYENIFSASTKDGKGQRLTIGFGKQVKQGIEMTTPVKKIGTSNLKTLIEENKITNLTDDIVLELCTFISVKNSWGAAQGKHDDLVMGLVLFSWAISQPFFKEFSEHDIVSSLLNSMSEENDDELLPLPVFSNFNDPSNSLNRNNDNAWLF